MGAGALAPSPPAQSAVPLPPLSGRALAVRPGRRGLRLRRSPPRRVGCPGRFRLRPETPAGLRVASSACAVAALCCARRARGARRRAPPPGGGWWVGAAAPLSGASALGPPARPPPPLGSVAVGPARGLGPLRGGAGGCPLRLPGSRSALPALFSSRPRPGCGVRRRSAAAVAIRAHTVPLDNLPPVSLRSGPAIAVAALGRSSSPAAGIDRRSQCHAPPLLHPGGSQLRY